MFESAKLKIKRADHHITDLERQLAAFTRQNFDKSVRKADQGKVDITITVLTPPPEIALTIGDAIHNLWTSLDHLMWEIVGFYNGGQHDQLYFPKGRDRASYEGLCGSIEAPPAVKQRLEAIEAFPGGAGHFLYVTHSLDRTDKHTALTPVIHAPTADELMVVTDGGTVRRRLSELYGSPFVLQAGETFTLDGAFNDTGLAFENDAEISPHILFGDVEFVKDEPIIPTLFQLRHAVANAIDTIASSIS